MMMISCPCHDQKFLEGILLILIYISNSLDLLFASIVNIPILFPLKFHKYMKGISKEEYKLKKKKRLS